MSHESGSFLGYKTKGESMIQKEAREIWIKALRSGVFKQGQSYLSRKTSSGDVLNCCLGVACELYLIHEPDGGLEKSIDENGIDGTFITYDLMPGSLPDKVKNWLGLADRAGVYNQGDCALTADNDDGKSFEDIADIIESEPEGLFVNSTSD
jgi:hypothetical protein